MPKKKLSLVDSIRSEIEIARGKVAEAQDKADLWNSRLADAQQEVYRLETALAGLEGTAPPPSAKKAYPDVKMVDADAVARFAANREKPHTIHDEMLPESRPIITAKPNRIMFNGMEIELEPGMRVAKNSFGEDCLVPEGMPNLPPMDEPTFVRKPDFSLPAVGAKDGFSDPKDLF